ncbi:MAG: serine protease, partial [Algoriphagus sp.]|uniref:S1 family peptidase n=1 Tax=Algoriphagus sp. TaxID=1872435 RepID=UPI0032995AC8
MNTSLRFRLMRERVYLIVFLNDRQQPIASGSGFWAGGHLVTNNHVFSGPACDIVSIQSEPKPGVICFHEFKYDVFKSRLVTGSDENSHDFAVLDIPELRNLSEFQFNLVGHQNSEIGDPVAALGFPFGSESLSIHQGWISGYRKSGVADAIQLDMSVNQSNSGGPLVDSSGDVIGIITRKSTGLTKAFDGLEESVKGNIRLIETQKKAGFQGYAVINGLDPIQSLLASQHQM